MITQKEYKRRRDKLLRKLSNNSIGILFSSEYKTRSNDTQYPYRQNSNFYYLTGFKEDNSALVFVKTNDITKIILFVQKKDETLELWNGKRLGEIEARKKFLLDEVCIIDDLDKRLKEFAKSANKLYFDLDSKDKRVKKFKKNITDSAKYKNISQIIYRMRLIKSDAEIELIKKAIGITKKAHHKAMEFKKHGKNEYELQAEIEYIFKKHGAYSDAYTSIVAGGNSANTLHYISNDKSLQHNELILIDAGCEYDCYASDITRCIPVGGKFTPAQRELYNMVLEVQVEIIEMIKPGVKRSELHKRSEELLCEGMVKLGIIEGKCKKLLKKQRHKKYYPHGIGHWMGLDVHDEAPYKDKKGKEIPLKKGMVLTIEPGIYIDKNDNSVPEKYRGIGIRIEDNILVTLKGHKNLSKKIAKSVEAIEAISKS